MAKGFTSRSLRQILISGYCMRASSIMIKGMALVKSNGLMEVNTKDTLRIMKDMVRVR